MKSIKLIIIAGRVRGFIIYKSAKKYDSANLVPERLGQDTANKQD